MNKNGNKRPENRSVTQGTKKQKTVSPTALQLVFMLLSYKEQIWGSGLVLGQLVHSFYVIFIPAKNKHRYYRLRTRDWKLPPVT